MRWTENANVLHFRCDANRVQLTMVVVRCAIGAMHGHVNFVRPGDEPEVVEMKPDDRLALKFAGFGAFDIGIRPVAAHALGAEEADTEYEITKGLIRANAESNFDRLARLEDVRGGTVASQKLNRKDLGLSRSPPALSHSTHVRDGGGPLRQHRTRLRRQRPIFFSRDIEQVAVDHALRIAMRACDSMVEPECFIAETRDEIESV